MGVVEASGRTRGGGAVTPRSCHIEPMHPSMARRPRGGDTGDAGFFDPLR
jgi:hypothetical protein